MQSTKDTIVCCICKENVLHRPKDSPIDEGIVTTECGHVGHAQCFTAWFTVKEQEWDQSNPLPCPKCLQPYFGRNTIPLYPEIVPLSDSIDCVEREQLNKSFEEKISLRKSLDEIKVEHEKERKTDREVIQQLTYLNNMLIHRETEFKTEIERLNSCLMRATENSQKQDEIRMRVIARADRLQQALEEREFVQQELLRRQ